MISYIRKVFDGIYLIFYLLIEVPELWLFVVGLSIGLITLYYIIFVGL
jgi:hypothetical protein